MWISLPLEADVDRLVDHAFAPQPLIEAELMHQVDRALLQHAGAHADPPHRRGSRASSTTLSMPSR